MTKGTPMTKHYLYSEHPVDGLATPPFLSILLCYNQCNYIALDPVAILCQRDLAVGVFR